MGKHIVREYYGRVYDPITDCPCRYLITDDDRITPRDMFGEFEGKKVLVMIVDIGEKEVK